MKILKPILIVLLILVALPLISALFVSKDLNFEKSITIEAPIDHVWEQVNSLEDMDKWSPWNDYDPDMKKEMSGTDGTIGAKQSWESKVENVGKGSQTISRIDPPNVMGTDLKFYTPFESAAKAYVELAEAESGTKVTWRMESQLPYPMNLMKVIMDFDAAMDKDFGSGLGKLKNLSESTLPVPEPEPMELEASEQSQE